MAQISAALVKELRDQTGVGMMDCKKALTEMAGDLEGAVDWLRKQGMAAAAKKAGRIAAEGLIGIAVGARIGAIVEVNSETDFVARNETFQNFVETVARLTLQHGQDMEQLAQAEYPGSERNVQDELTNLVSTIGENMTLRRGGVLKVTTGVIGNYTHNAQAPNLGRIGVIVALESEGNEQVLQAFGRQLAMHIAAGAPQAVSVDDLEPALVEREKNVLLDQARQSGRPEEIINKMVEGRLRKYFEEVVLLKQTWVIDGEGAVEKALQQAAKDAGAEIAIKGFIRYVLGEGIEKKEVDFAEEVKSVRGG